MQLPPGLCNNCAGRTQGKRRYCDVCLSHKRKYKNHPTTVATPQGPKVRASKKEARREAELRLMERAGKVKNLRCQVSYDLEVNGMWVATYIADFVYEELQG